MSAAAHERFSRERAAYHERRAAAERDSDRRRFHEREAASWHGERLFYKAMRNANGGAK